MVSRGSERRRRIGGRGAPLLTTGLLAGLLLGPIIGGSAGASPQGTHKAHKASTSAINVTSACHGTPRRGGTLVYARSEGPVTLDTYFPTNGNGDIFIDYLIYQPLVMPTPKGGAKLVPGVASSWTVSNGGKTYTFHIRPGIKFSNGQPVTATDVKFSLDEFDTTKADTTVVLAQAFGFKTATVVNPTTVQMNLTAPAPGILNNISIFDAYIVPENVFRSEGTKFWTDPVGTGPFKVTNWAHGSSITLVRNPYYWQKGLPYLTKVKFLYVTTGNTRLLDLEDQQAQIATAITFSDIPSVKGNSQLVLQLGHVPYWMGLWMNEKKPQFKTLDVRQAIQYAIDKPLINKRVFSGVGKIPNSILPQFATDASTRVIKPYPFNVKKARRLLSKSRFPHGFSTTLSYPSGSIEFTEAVLLLQSELSKIGIHLKLLSQTEATVTTKWSTASYTMTFPFVEFTSDVAVPDEYATFVTAAEPLHAFESYWTNPKVTKMVTTYVHTPKPSRLKLWHRIQKAMLVQTPDINVMDLPFTNVHLRDVCGTYLDALGADSLQYTWIAKSK
ncbi:MAG: ABC transporter substrate-binding protein [Acidimicrobiales bacterium]